MPSVGHDCFAQAGSSLLEALFALVTFSIGLLGLAGTLGTALRVNGDARLHNEAAHVAQALIGEMWTTSNVHFDAQYGAGQPGRTQWENRVTSRLPAAMSAVEVADASATLPGRSVVVTLSWSRPGSSERHRYVTAARIGRNP
jgi:type IV pilus assembly protein PilV